MKMFEMTGPAEARIGETIYRHGDRISGCTVIVRSAARGQLQNVAFERLGHGTLSIGFGPAHVCDEGETTAEVVFSGDDADHHGSWYDIKGHQGIGNVSRWISQMLQNCDPDEGLPQ